jgi:hypothetical protein
MMEIYLIGFVSATLLIIIWRFWDAYSLKYDLTLGDLVFTLIMSLLVGLLSWVSVIYIIGAQLSEWVQLSNLLQKKVFKFSKNTPPTNSNL